MPHFIQEPKGSNNGNTLGKILAFLPSSTDIPENHYFMESFTTMSDSPYVIEVTSENYQQVVIQGSMQVPVLVDFWAEWCQPCKMLMPLLSKLADEYQGKFIVAKINTEEQQELATQFGIRSIPTVKLFKDGQPVDEFAGALPEPQIKQFLDKHIVRESDNLVAVAQQHLLQGDADTALQILNQALEQDPGNNNIRVGLAQVHAAMAQVEKSLEILDALPADMQDEPEVAGLRGHLFFDVIAAQSPPVAELEARLSADENDSEARYQLAAHNVVGQNYQAALEGLLILMQKDRQFGEDAARTALLTAFNLLGDDPLVPRYRSKMMSLIY